MEYVGHADDSYIFGEVKPVPNHTSVTHSIKANEKTRFSGIINNLSPVNSYHDFGVSKLPAGCDALAYATDSVLEAFMSSAEKVYGLMASRKVESQLLKCAMQINQRDD